MKVTGKLFSAALLVISLESCATSSHGTELPQQYRGLWAEQSRECYIKTTQGNVRISADLISYWEYGEKITDVEILNGKIVSVKSLRKYAKGDEVANTNLEMQPDGMHMKITTSDGSWILYKCKRISAKGPHR